MSSDANSLNDIYPGFINSSANPEYSSEHVDVPNERVYMVCGVLIAMVLVAVIIVILAVTISKLRKREETAVAAAATAAATAVATANTAINNNSINNNNNVDCQLSHAQPVDVAVVTTVSGDVCDAPVPLPFLWQYSALQPKTPMGITHHTGCTAPIRTHWCAVYPSKKLQSTARDYGKTCEASGEDWCTKSNSNKTHTKYPQNYGTSSNRYMCTDSKKHKNVRNPRTEEPTKTLRSRVSCINNYQRIIGQVWKCVNHRQIQVGGREKGVEESK
ncbi:hypothetical protein ACI65C_001453 [Semiaphis heraclei]